RRKPAGSAQLDFDFAPARVVGPVAWSIAEDILVSQLHADFGGDIRQLFNLFHVENAAAGHFRYFIEKRGTIEFFRGPAVSRLVKDADGIELGVGFLHQTLDIAFVVPTMIIASIG